MSASLASSHIDDLPSWQPAVSQTTVSEAVRRAIGGCGERQDYPPAVVAKKRGAMATAIDPSVASV